MKTSIPTLDAVMSAIQPSEGDKKAILSNYIILISKILIDNMSYFHLTFSDLYIPHIGHKYSDEMSKKSEDNYLKISYYYNIHPLFSDTFGGFMQE